jgi:hypothetical protein
MSPVIDFVAAEIEIPEKVEVFRSDDTQTEFAYPVQVKAKHAAVYPARLVGGRWFFGLNGRGYYIKDATLSAFKIEPHITHIPSSRLSRAFRKR